jgi:hypothetical protein
MSKVITNGYRMSLAEWLYRMTIAKLSPGKRVVAIYAAAFNITSNDELKMVTGLSTNTLDAIKRELPKDGFIIVGPGGGRGRRSSVSPAYRQCPVSFTDIEAKNHTKFWGGYPVQNPPAFGVLSDDKPPQTLGGFSGETSPNSGDVYAQTTPKAGDVSPRVRARIEPPSGVLSTKEVVNSYNTLEGVDTTPRASAHTPKAEPKEPKDQPHMNGVGFVISAQHDLIIPLETIQRWRVRFPAIPDLEAKLEKLAAHILVKGPFGCAAGWQQPEAWMAGLLSDENSKAKAAQAKAQGPQKTSTDEHLRILAGLPK